MAYKIQLHLEAADDFSRLDGSIKKEVAKKIDALSENPLLGNKAGIDLSGFYKLYVSKTYYLSRAL